MATLACMAEEAKQTEQVDARRLHYIETTRPKGVALGELGLLHRGSERQGFVASRFKILAAVLHVHLFSNQGSSSLRSRLEMCTRP